MKKRMISNKGSRTGGSRTGSGCVYANGNPISYIDPTGLWFEVANTFAGMHGVANEISMMNWEVQQQPKPDKLPSKITAAFLYPKIHHGDTEKHGERKR